MEFLLRVASGLLLLTNVSTAKAGLVFNVLDYGARNDASASATVAIRSAIQAAKAAGGGTVFVPAGKYVTGPVELVSNLVLHIDAGAVLEFPATTDMPLMHGRLLGTECLTPVPLIGGTNLENVSITGRGTVTTTQDDWRKLTSAAAPRGLWPSILERIEFQRPVPPEDFRNAARGLRPVFIGATESKNVLIEGIHIVGSPMWTIHILYCQHVVMRDLIIETFPGVQTDGMDIDSSRDVMVSDCYLDTGDDAICLKSGRDADGRPVNRPTENVTITNCTVHRAHGAIALGSETAAGIRNVVASNIVCRGTEKGVRVKSTRGRGGVVENIRFQNWTMEDVGVGIQVTGYYKPSSPEPASERTPGFRNIAISNMTIKNSPTAISIEGLPEAPVSGLRISDVIASGNSGMRAYHTQALELHHVQMNVDHGPAFLIQDSHDLELDGVSTRRPLAGVPVIRLDRCPGTIVRGSRAFEGTGTFLSVAPGELKSIVFSGNTLADTTKAVVEARADYWAPVQ
jgi:polygalacturonase